MDKQKKNKEIYCHSDKCFNWINPFVSIYCTNCEFQRKDFEDQELQNLLFESYSKVENKEDDCKSIDSCRCEISNNDQSLHCNVCEDCKIKIIPNDESCETNLTLDEKTNSIELIQNSCK